MCVLAIERHPFNEEMIAADPNIKRSRAISFGCAVIPLTGFGGQLVTPRFLHGCAVIPLTEFGGQLVTPGGWLHDGVELFSL